MADYTVEGLIKLGLDPQLAKQSIDYLASMRKGMEDAKRQADEYRNRLQSFSNVNIRMLDRLGLDDQTSKKAVAALKSVRDEVDKLASAKLAEALQARGLSEQEAARTAQTLVNLKRQQEEGGSNSGTRGLRRTAGALTGLGFGEAGFAVNRFADLSEVNKRIHEIVSALAEVGNEGSALTGVLAGIGGEAAVVATALGLVLAALALVAIGVNNYNNTLKESDAALKLSSEGLKEFYAAIATGTTESINAQIKSTKDQKTLIDAELKQRQDAVDNAFKAEQGNFGGDAAARLKFALAGAQEGFKDNAARIEELKKQSADADAKLLGLNQAIDSTGVAANDATQRMKDLSDAQKELADSKAKDAEKALADQRQREAEAAAVAKDAIAKYTSAISLNASAQIALRDATAARQQVLDRRAEQDAIDAKRTAVANDYQQRIDAAKQNEALDKLDQDYFSGEIDANNKFIDEQRKTDTRAARERIQLLEDANRDLLHLAGAGDVAAFVIRQQQAKADLKKQAENQDDATKDRVATFNRERDDARKHYEDQRRLQQNDNRESLRLQQEFDAIKEQWKVYDLQRSRDLEQQDYDMRYAALAYHLSETEALLAQSYANQRQLLIDSLMAGGPLGDVSQNDPSQVYTSPGSGGTGTINRFAVGTDFVPYDQLAFIHKGERIIPAAQNRPGAMQPITVQITAVVGDVAAKSYVDQMQYETVQGVKGALQLARGRGEF